MWQLNSSTSCVSLSSRYVNRNSKESPVKKTGCVVLTPKQVTDEYGNWFEIKFGKGSIKVNNEFAEMFGLTWKTPEKDQEKENE